MTNYQYGHKEFVKIYRRMLNWDWYTDIPVKVLYLHCILRANWKPDEWRGIAIERGQFVTSLQSLALETGLTLQQIRTALSKLIDNRLITDFVMGKKRVITVLNYDSFQGEQQIINRERNRLSTETPQISNNSNKNIKNIKNNKNIDLDLDLDRETASPRDDYYLSKPSLEDIDNYAKARQSVVDPKRFFDYYNNQGWTIKGEPISNWRAVFQSWEKKEKKKTAEAKPVVILFEDRNSPPYYGFPAEWFDGDSIVPERVRSGAYRYSEYDVQQLSAEEMIKTFNDVKEEDERQRKIYEYYERQRSDSGSDLSE